MSLHDIPPEVLDSIAFFLATDPLLGSPTNLISLVSLSRHTFEALSFDNNPSLYARICIAKFDLAAPTRRLAQDTLSSHALVCELQKRCTVLKRLRSLTGVRLINPSPWEEDQITELLWTAFFMVLENQGRNVAQLRNAGIVRWLDAYWFDEAGSSGAVHSLQIDEWPASGLGASFSSGSARRCKPHLALAMWLLWFFFDPGSYIPQPELFRKVERLLKLIALNAPSYPLTQVPWTSFSPGLSHIHFGTENVRFEEPISVGPQELNVARSRASGIAPVIHFNTELHRVAPPPAAPPAILAYLALTARARRDAHEGSIFGLGGGIHVYDTRAADGIDGDDFVAFRSTYKKDAQEGIVSPGVPLLVGDRRWECEWERCLNPDSLIGEYQSVQAFTPGSLEGDWEGTFTYTEFHSFAALLAGGKPSKLRDCILAQHNQTWRMHEYHLLAPSATSGQKTDEQVRMATPDPSLAKPLPVGEPVLAHIPSGATFSSSETELSISLPTISGSGSSLRPQVYTYTRYQPAARAHESDKEREAYKETVRDVILTGEGHSGWGEFRLVGRVRPCDGFVSVLKEYTGTDRGRWLYRGYLIGDLMPSGGVGADGDGYLVGRWRDTLTPAETHGYEGAFALSRRR